MQFERIGFLVDSAGRKLTGAAAVVDSASMTDEQGCSPRPAGVNPRSLIDLQRMKALQGGTVRGGTGASERPSERLRVPLPPPDLLQYVAWLIVVSAADEAAPREQGWLVNLRPFLWSKGEVTIGRELADIKFANQALSKLHLAISLDDGGCGFLVRDLDSTNGSFLSHNLHSEFSQILMPTVLRDGNALRIGDVMLVFRCYRRAGNG
jgi:hypothetical protein